MHPASYRVDGTLEDAVEALAGRAADLRTRPYTAAEKRAVAASDVLGSLGRAAKDHPMLGSALLGGALGAGAGGLSASVANADEPEHRRRSVLGSALTGGLAGAGVGAGLSALRSGLSGLNIRRHDALTPGAFTDPSTGRKMVISPEAIRADPDLPAAVQASSAENPSLPERAVGGLWEAVKTPWKVAPVSATALAGGAIGDQMLNSERLRTGEWFGGRAPGMIDPRHSTMPGHLEGGILDVINKKDNALGFRPEQVDALKDIMNGPDRERILAEMNGTRTGKPYTHPAPARPSGGAASEFISDVGVTPPPEPHFTADRIRDLREHGARLSAEQLGKDKFLGLASTRPRIQRGVLGGLREQPLSRMHPQRFLPRALLAGALPAAEISYNAWRNQAGRQRTLDDILADLRRRNLVKEVE